MDEKGIPTKELKEGTGKVFKTTSPIVDEYRLNFRNKRIMDEAFHSTFPYLRKENMPNKIKESYKDGVCPDCQSVIPDDVVNGVRCGSCGHIFYSIKRPIVVKCL